MRQSIYLLLMAMCWCALSQQDPLYSQYQFNQLMINPAYAGVYNRLNVGMISRFQWTGIEGSPQTNTLMGNTSLSQGKIGLGGFVINDRFGVNSNYEVQVAGSYNIQFDRFTKLAMGLQGGWIQYGYDFSSVNLDYFDDVALNTGHETFSKPNFGVGFMLLNKNFFVGASIPRILNVSVNDGSSTSDRYKRHYYLSGGAAGEINGLPFKAIGILNSIAGQTLSTDLSMSVLLDDVLWAGLTMRDIKHFGAMLILEAGENLKFGYSFELPSNNLIHGNWGTHEVSIAYNINYERGFLRKLPVYF